MSGWAIIDDREAAPEPIPVTVDRAELLGIRRATYGRRVSATIIDVIPALVFAAPLAFALTAIVGPDGQLDILMLILGSACALLLVLYGILQLSSHGRRGQTFGKQATKLRTLRATSLQPIRFGRALLRALIVAAACLVPLLGPLLLFLSPLWDPQKRGRGWHDHATDAWMIDLRAVDPTDPVAFGDARARARVKSAARGDARQTDPFARERVIADVPRAETPRAPEAPAPASEAPATPPIVRDPPRAPESAPTRERAASVGVRVTLDDGATLTIAGPTLIGRRPAPADGDDPAVRLLPLADEGRSLSKTHLALQVDAHGLVLTDRGSANGTTIVRGATSAPASADTPLRVREGDRIRLGDREIVVGPMAPVTD
ncbi:RDD family protein [Microbacterium sp. G2-8]|uniref:RDD family protein n=1 Tax=Microbacterium sp. G2-8 TaxID=2842454 RepID=UPI001C8A2D12|nr:RDD family protein [Microbacterium sp. G2-8]